MYARNRVGSQSISICRMPREIRKFGGRRVQTSRDQTNIILLANTFLASDDSACVRVGHAWPSIRIFAYVIMMFLPSQLAHGRVNELWP